MARKQASGNPALGVAYLRVSTEEQSLGPEAQRASIAAWAQRQGVTMVSWHEDRISGGAAVDERDGLMAALAALRSQGAGVLVAAKRDRIARDVVVAATVERLAQDAGARVVTADGVSADDTPEGALMRGLLDLFAAHERAVIRSRTKAALAVKRARGEKLGGAAPFGFVAVEGMLREDPAEQAVIERVAALRAAGLSQARIVARLTADGTPCRGGCWHATTVARILAATTARKAA